MIHVLLAVALMQFPPGAEVAYIGGHQPEPILNVVTKPGCTATLQGNEVVITPDQQLDAKDKQLEATEKERDAYMTAAKGSFWHRLGNCGVKVGVGAGSGGAFGGARGAGYGAAIGLGSCLLFK